MTPEVLDRELVRRLLLDDLLHGHEVLLLLFLLFRLVFFTLLDRLCVNLIYIDTNLLDRLLVSLELKHNLRVRFTTSSLLLFLELSLPAHIGSLILFDLSCEKLMELEVTL